MGYPHGIKHPIGFLDHPIVGGGREGGGGIGDRRSSAHFRVLFFVRPRLSALRNCTYDFGDKRVGVIVGFFFYFQRYNG